MGSIFFGGLVQHFIIEPKFFTSADPVYSPRINADSSFSFVKPLLAVELYENRRSQKYKDIFKILNDLVTKSIDSKMATQISVYFRDLKTAEWIGINEDLLYNPASLLKLPIIMAYYKQAETNPNLLSQKFLYNSTDASDIEANQMQHPLSPSQEYTVEELIENMIIYSDNKAMSVLLKHIDNNTLDQVFSILGIRSPDQQPPGEYGISPKNYSLFFRILRNATYLSPEMSEKALKLLTQTTFKDGLAAGVPNTIAVAHKFGLYATRSDNTVTGIELHDCGIVYNTPDNYLLCVMTKGDDVQTLKNVIKNISTTAYNEVGATLTP